MVSGVGVGASKPRSYSKQVQPSSQIGLDLIDNNSLDASGNFQGVGRAKSNSLNKTPEIKGHFRKNE